MGISSLFLLLLLAFAFGGKVQLSSKYTLEWNIDTAASTVEFKINVSSISWIGFGFHPVGSGSDEDMDNADAVIATFDTGKPVLTDYFSQSFFEPPQDVLLGGTNDVLKPVAMQKDGKTSLSFTRKLVTGDQYDVPFTIGPMKVIWAIGKSNTWEYHGLDTNNRGDAIVDFFEKDVCGPSKDCKSCLSHSTCVYCGSDNLCYDKTNFGNCETRNTTCQPQWKTGE